MLTAVCVAACIAVGVVPGFGQPGPVDMMGEGANSGQAAKVALRLDMLRMWMLIDRLEVREDQAAALFPVWSSHRRHRQELKTERSQLAEQLEKALADQVSGDRQLLQRMAALEEVEVRLLEAEQVFQQDLGQVLDVRQRARLLLFPDQFRGDLTEMVRGLRNMPSPRALQGGRGWPAGRGGTGD